MTNRKECFTKCPGCGAVFTATLYMDLKHTYTRDKDGLILNICNDCIKEATKIGISNFFKQIKLKLYNDKKNVL